MNEDRAKSNLVSMAGFCIGSILWIYFFSKLGVGINSATDMSVFSMILKREFLINFGAMAVFFGVSSSMLVFDTFKRPIMDRIGVAFVGIVITYVVTSGFLIFSILLMVTPVFLCLAC